MKPDYFGLIMRVVVMDVAVIAVYWLLVCGVDILTKLLPDALSMLFILALWSGLFFGLFYSNSLLFTWIKNTYVWSLSTAFLTLSIVIPVIIASTHKPCFFMH